MRSIPMGWLKNHRRAAALAALALSALSPACTRFPSRNTPIWVWYDMRVQPKFKPQLQTTFFADGRMSRRPVHGTLAQENYSPEPAFASGVQNGQYVAKNPEPITMELLNRGQRQFNVYCTPCHDRTGSGRGIVPSKAIWVPGNMHDDRVVNMVDGEIFHVASYGRRSMPGYRFQISESDRWAIVAYVRALQLSWRGTINDVPAELQSKLR